jgi:hypothetical protein
MARRIIVGSQFQDRKATDFNGVDQYAFCDNPSFKSNTQGAFLFRYRPSSLLAADGIKGIMSMGVLDAGNNSSFRILQRYSGSTSIDPTWRSRPIPDVACRSANGGSSSSAYGQHIFSNATWVNWVVQSNGTAYQHSIDGNLITSAGWLGANNGDWLGDVSGSNHRFAIAVQFQSNSPQNFSDHRHNEILYVSRPLTALEVAEWHNGGTPSNAHRLSFRPDIVSWWRMGESRDNGTTIFDEIGSNNLTLVNMSAANYLDV